MTTDIARRWNALVDNKWEATWIGTVCKIRNEHGETIASAPTMGEAIDKAIKNTEGK